MISTCLLKHSNISEILITYRQCVCELGSNLGISWQHISCEKDKNKNKKTPQSAEISLRHSK